MYWQYLSYADCAGFRGACIVPGDDVVQAAKEARRLGISPGGQVISVEIDPKLIPEHLKLCLLTESQVRDELGATVI